MRIFTTVLLLLFFTDVFAYLDPGTGSMLLQVILGGIAAVGVALKLYWHKLRAALGMAKKEEPEDESA
jgi:amino acid permease